MLLEKNEKLLYSQCLKVPKVSGQRILGEIGDERNIKRKRDDTENDLQWVKKGKKSRASMCLVFE